MKPLNIYDTVRLTSLIKEATSKAEDSFTLLSSGDQVIFMPCVFGDVATLKVYFNLERIETTKADYLNENGISNASIVRIIEELDEKVSEKYNR